MKLRTEIIIDVPAEIVWHILTELEAYRDWNPFILESSGKIEPGARLRNVMKSGDGKMTFKPKVLKVEPGRYFDWLGSLFFKGLFDGHHYFELKPTRPNQVLLIHGENFSGLLAKPLLKRIGEQTRENFIAMNHAIKARAEAQLSTN